MKKKLFCLLMAAALLLSGCCMSHEWADADCDTPKTCTKCDKTEGEALGHSWADADCDTPKTCAVCGETEGEALGHSWADATCEAAKTCTVCGATEGEALPHEVKWSFRREEKMMEGDCALCGNFVEQELDWILAADDRVMGRWNARFITKQGGTPVPMDSGYMEFHEDGTFDMDLAGVAVNGTWKFDKMQDSIITAYNYKLEDSQGGVYWVIFMMDADNNFTLKVGDMSVTCSKAF